jgi:Fe-S oxidoreductase
MGGTLTQLEQAVGAELVRDIGPGRPLRRHDVRAAVLVKRGAMVQITIGQGQRFAISARLVAEHTFEACRFLWDLHCRNRLALDFHPVHARVAYHQPCHVRAIDHESPGPQLMRLLPRLNVEQVEKGCSGMAGTWGLQKKNYRNSLRIGWPLLSAMRASPTRTATTECSACKMQIEHGSGLTTIHPIKLLAYAYGRLPALGAALGARA